MGERGDQNQAIGDRWMARAMGNRLSEWWVVSGGPVDGDGYV